MVSIFINVIIHVATLKSKSLKWNEHLGVVSYLPLDAVIETIQLFHLSNMLTYAVRIVHVS